MKPISIEKKGFTWGLMITAALIAFFFLMKAVGLVHNFNLRALNGVIMFAGVYMAIKTFKKSREKHFEYMNGMGVGLLTSLVTAATFTVFVVLYVVLNPDFMEAIKAEEPQGIYLNEFAVGIVIFIEAMASGFIFSFLSMQWLKENNSSSVKKKSVSPTNINYSGH